MTMQKTVRAALGLSLGALINFACSHAQQPLAKVDDSALARLNEQQMQPVDDARIEEGRARDQQARAHAAVMDAKAKIDVARAEREVAAAQLNRSKAEFDLLNKEKADTADLQRAKSDASVANDRVKSADLKIEYLTKAANVAELEERVAAQHVLVAQQLTEKAKFDALKTGQPNQVRDINPATLDSQLASAQQREAQLRKEAADQRVSLVETYNKWQELDARVRSMPQPRPQEPAQPQLPSQPVR